MEVLGNVNEKNEVIYDIKELFELSNSLLDKQQGSDNKKVLINEEKIQQIALSNIISLLKSGKRKTIINKENLKLNENITTENSVSNKSNNNNGNNKSDAMFCSEIIFKTQFPHLISFFDNYEKLIFQYLQDNSPLTKNNNSIYDKNENANLLSIQNNIIEFLKSSNKVFQDTIKKHIIEINKEIDVVLPLYWENLFQKNKNKTTYHTILVVYLIYFDTVLTALKYSRSGILNKEYNKNSIDEYNANILLWTGLLHDISKHVLIDVEIKYNKENDTDIYYDHINKKILSDKIHPFKGGCIVLDIFKSKKIFNIDKKNTNSSITSDTNEMVEELLDSIKNILSYSVEFKYHERKKTTKFMQEHSRLSELSSKIIELKKLFVIENLNNQSNSESNLIEKHYLIKTSIDWVIDIFLLVIFHQSLPNCTKYRNIPILCEEHMKLFFDKRLLEMMKIVMINDSMSHAMFNDLIFEREITSNIDFLINKFKD